jgi:hypothetical protein
MIAAPSTPQECYEMWNAECDIPEGLCSVCPCVDITPISHKWYCPCGRKLRTLYEMKVRCEPMVVTSSRYYQPPQEEGQIEQLVSLPVLVVEE